MSRKKTLTDNENDLYVYLKSIKLVKKHLNNLYKNPLCQEQNLIKVLLIFLFKL